jgi:hypothetical protein
VRYSRADQIVPRDAWTTDVKDDRPVDTLLYTTSVVNTPSRVDNDILAGERKSEKYRSGPYSAGGEDRSR